MTSITNSNSNLQPGIDRPLKIGTRQSPLAVAQAEMVSKAIRESVNWRPEQVELVPMVASGDKIVDRALADLGGKALWTKELDRALQLGEIDCAVHSMKDVETIRPDNFVIAAMLERADIHDRLVGADAIDALPSGAVVGSASPRRKAQLLRQRADLDVRLIRGNVQTRLGKIANGEYAATLLAAAGLDRLGMNDIGAEISENIMLPAPAQGAIGIETLKTRTHVLQLLAKISSESTCLAIMAERAFLKELTADCHSPVAALATCDGLKMRLRGEILLPDGSESQSGEIRFEDGDGDAPARLARQLLEQASAELNAIFGQ